MVEVKVSLAVECWDVNLLFPLSSLDPCNQRHTLRRKTLASLEIGPSQEKMTRESGVGRSQTPLLCPEGAGTTPHMPPSGSTGHFLKRELAAQAPGASEEHLKHGRQTNTHRGHLGETARAGSWKRKLHVFRSEMISAP